MFVSIHNPRAIVMRAQINSAFKPWRSNRAVRVLRKNVHVDALLALANNHDTKRIYNRVYVRVAGNEELELRYQQREWIARRCFEAIMDCRAACGIPWV